MWIEFSELVLYLHFWSTTAHAFQSKLQIVKNSESFRKHASGLSYNNKVGESRFSNLEKIKTRIENLNVDGESTDSKNSFYKIRHKGWVDYRPATTTSTTTENGLFETYDYFEDGDYDNFGDEDDDLEYEDDSFFNDAVDIQAEESTERPTIALKPMSPLSEYKWNILGSASKVTESRRNNQNVHRNSEHRRVSAVIEHSIRVNQLSKCRSPSPKVIPVQKEYPDSTKIYTPHCTVLHRCGEDTGCCKFDDTCQYKKRVLVQLYFYTKIFGSLETKVEKLSFFNHTECECRHKTDETSFEVEAAGDWSSLPLQSSDISAEIERCQCPKHFKISRSSVNTCSCDCYEKNKNCIPLKKGNEHFSMADRICIANNECTVPNCEYGNYSRKGGKCPSLEDKMLEYRRIKTN